MRCSFCSELSIECLIDLARNKFSAQAFPTDSTAFYQHHASITDLADSAAAGCDLCQLIVDFFKGMRWAFGENLWPRLELWEGSACDPELSAFAAAECLEVSDIKLAINANHLYVGNPLDDARVMDAIMVQIGPQETYDEENGYSDYPVMPHFTLAVTTPAEKAVHVGGFRIGRFSIDPDLGSAKNFTIARSWLAECRTHDGCFTKGPRKLPKRVVDIGPLELPSSSMRPRVHTSLGAEADYIALSHCWGGGISTMLTSKTYESYHKSLPYHELPANFRDVLSIAKELGIRYVWIDSLCIVQDSKSDWEEESNKMAAIYLNATLTISALVSPSSTAGILNTYDCQKSISPAPAALRAFRDVSRPEKVLIEWKPSNEEDLGRLQIDGALNQRGWCFQEHILSPSNLLFGSRQIYWKCCAGPKSADGLPDGNGFPWNKFPVASRVLYSGLRASASGTAQGQAAADVKVEVDRLALLEDYYLMAEDYSHRSLTFGSDKLAAFSGLARSLHPAIGGDYLAGVWTSDFSYGLRWERELTTAIHEVAKYRAPSWSWMVTDERINNPISRLVPNKEFDLELLEHKVALENADNPYGPISSCHVRVRGRTVGILRSEEIMEDNNDRELVLGHVSYDETVIPNGPVGFRYLHDLTVPGESGPAGTVFVSTTSPLRHSELDLDMAEIYGDGLLMLILQAGAYAEEGRRGEDGVFGLVVKPVEHEIPGAYERIGYVDFMYPDLEYLKNWDTTELVLV